MSPSFCRRPPRRGERFPAERGKPDTKEGKKKNKTLWNALLFALILAGTVYGVLHGQDLGALKSALSGCRTDWLILAAVCVVLSILCEATGEWMQLNSLGMSPGRLSCLASACVGFFFSAITPSATGGQPMQVYYLRQKGIPVSVTSVALLVVAMCYKTVLVIVSLALLILSPGALRQSLGGMMFLYYIGVVITAGWTVFLLFLIFRQRTARSILVWVMTVLEELRILKNRASLQASFEVSMDMYADTADHLKKHPLVLAQVFAGMVLRRAAYYSVAWCVYRAMGLSGTGWLTVVLSQAVIAICADMLPLPGGMGISEALFMKVCAPVFGAMALPGMILSRGIGHYCQLIFCGAAAMFALFRMSRRKKPEEEYEDYLE